MQNKQPEAKYSSCGSLSYRRFGSFIAPLTEGSIKIRIGRFGRGPTFKAGDLFTVDSKSQTMTPDKEVKKATGLMSLEEQIIFPHVPQEEKFSIIMGAFGKVIKNPDVQLIGNRQEVTELLLSVIGELRGELERKERYFGGFERLHSIYLEHNSLVQARNASDPRNAWPPPSRFERAYMGQSTPTTEEVERDKKIATLRAGAEVYSGLEREAALILDLITLMEDDLPPLNYAIAFPETLATIPLVAATLA